MMTRKWNRFSSSACNFILAPFLELYNQTYFVSHLNQELNDVQVPGGASVVDGKGFVGAALVDVRTALQEMLHALGRLALDGQQKRGVFINVLIRHHLVQKKVICFSVIIFFVDYLH
jgi:hypothetical protein